MSCFLDRLLFFRNNADTFSGDLGVVEVVAGGLSGVVCFIGTTILLHRRLFDHRILRTSSWSDVLILVIIWVQLAVGLATVRFSWEDHTSGTTLLHVGFWAQRLVTFHGGAWQMIPSIPFVYKLHIVLGLTVVLSITVMNNQDVFIQNILDPHPQVSLRSDFHWLRVNSGNDFSYFGGGPTQNTIFGCGGVAAKGQYELAYLLHFLLSVHPTHFLSFQALYGHAWGQGVINQTFVGNGGDYGYLEAILAF